MSSAELRQTPLHAWHESHHGRLVEFAGWAMPVQYSSIIDEHHAVRQRVGLFDISHMGRLSVLGASARDWIERLTTNQVARLSEGRIQYSLMVNEAGGVLDDILVYRTAAGYSIVCNASNREKVIAQFEAHRPDGNAAIEDRTERTAMIAVQGPLALEVLQPLAAESLSALRYYHCAEMRIAGTEAIVSRTGYTGEDGFELIVDAGSALEVWTTLLDSGRGARIQPCGLGARDTLRFEAAMPLYGHELDESIDPFEAGLDWAVKLDKGDFLGREALRTRQTNRARRRIGLWLEDKRIARQGYAVLHDTRRVGVVTSGTFAPTLQRSLAMALVDVNSANATSLEVDIRGRSTSARIVPLPFYKRERPVGSTPAPVSN